MIGKMFCCRRILRNCVKLDASSEGKRRSGIVSKSVAVYDNGDKDITTYPKSKEQEEMLRRAIAKNEFLPNILQGKSLQDSIDCMYLQDVKTGEIIIQEGAIGSHLYISDHGTFEITQHGNKIREFNDVRVFGELAILYTTDRSATVKALTEGRIWVLDCPTYKKLIIRSAIEEQEEIVSFMMKVPVLKTASKDKLYLVAKLFNTEFFFKDKEIVKQCELGDKFYIIRAGTVSVEKDGKKVAELSKGEYFGELALLKEEFRQATVIANEPGTDCLTLSRKDFIDHFGEVQEFMNLKTAPEPHAEKYIEFANLDLKDLKVIQTVGMGAYGRVQLVQCTHQKNKVFALKYLKKADISKLTHRKQVFNEKDLHMSCINPFITRMYRTYKDSKYLYFLIEACLGGDLWGLLHKQKKKVFDDVKAQFYAGCVLEGISYLHSCGIIYRDLKPENVLIHHTGYLKLADFGFAKELASTETTYTFVGTAEYVAPEIIQNKGYNKSADYWAFGVFMHELLVGKTPFRTRDNDHLTTYKLILKGINDVVFPYHVTKKARDLIKKLCSHQASDRLGSQKDGIDDIRNHKWFAGLDWVKLRNQELEPPYKPYLEHITDTRYFEKYNNHENAEDDFGDWDAEF